MAVITIYGASDDLIEIEGDLREEFNECGDEKGYVVCADGTALKASYDDEGIWRFNCVAQGSAEFTKVEGTDPDGRDDYTDRVTLKGDIRWIAHAQTFERVKEKQAG